MTNAGERVSRQQEVRTERRRRDDATIDGSQALNMAIPPEIQARLDEQGRVPRWVNDVGNRMHRMTVLDDWDKVEGVDPREVVIDIKKGTTCKAVLLSKPKQFIVEDRAKQDLRRRQTEKAMLEGNVPDAGDKPIPRPDNIYADKANKIERGNQII